VKSWRSPSCWRPATLVDLRRWATSPPIAAASAVKKLSNGKKKGQGNSKNGNKYLAWAFVEAANFAIRFNEQAKRFYQRKAAKKTG
jgi:transposase